MRISSNYTFTLCELPLSTKKLLNFLFRSSLVLPSLFGFLPFKSFVFHRLLILSHPVVWQCKLRWRTMEAIGNNQNQVTLYRSSHWELLCKRYVRVCRVFRSALDEKVIPKGGCFFPARFTWDKNWFIIPEILVFWYKKYIQNRHIF